MSQPQAKPLQRFPVFDEEAVERAEAALKALSGNFQVWLEDEVEKVQAARLSARAAGWTDESIDELFAAAHDAKGLGATYDYPFVTRIAASLCRLIETPEGKAVARAQPALVEAHVDTIRAAVRDRIKTEDHPVGRLLSAELERRVEALGVAPV
ncbi:MAG: Hpt domain-containing protein [Hyphomonadaceae bacterium]